MIEPYEPGKDDPDRRGAWQPRLLTMWRFLRVAVQLAVAAAMLSQQGGIALAISGAALVLETIQDRLSAGPDRGGCCRRPE